MTPTSVIAVAGDVALGDARQAEVEDLHGRQLVRRVARRGEVRATRMLVGRASARDDDVRRLEVAVDDAALVGVVDRLAERRKRREAEAQLRLVQRAGARGEAGVELAAAHQLHREEVLAVARCARTRRWRRCSGA